MLFQSVSIDLFKVSHTDVLVFAGKNLSDDSSIDIDVLPAGEEAGRIVRCYLKPLKLFFKRRIQDEKDPCSVFKRYMCFVFRFVIGDHGDGKGRKLFLEDVQNPADPLHSLRSDHLLVVQEESFDEIFRIDPHKRKILSLRLIRDKHSVSREKKMSVERGKIDEEFRREGLDQDFESIRIQPLRGHFLDIVFEAPYGGCDFIRIDEPKRSTVDSLDGLVGDVDVGKLVRPLDDDPIGGNPEIRGAEQNIESQNDQERSDRNESGMVRSLSFRKGGIDRTEIRSPAGFQVKFHPPERRRFRAEQKTFLPLLPNPFPEFPLSETLPHPGYFSGNR